MAMMNSSVSVGISVFHWRTSVTRKLTVLTGLMRSDVVSFHAELDFLSLFEITAVLLFHSYSATDWLFVKL